MYTALTHTFMYAEALVTCLPVPGTWADPYTFNFQQKDGETTPVWGAVISFPNLIIAMHGLRYCTVLIALFGGVLALTQRVMLPFTVHVY